MNHWLFKSEPDCFSINHLSKLPKQTSSWDGVRNYQVRNMLRDQIKVGDRGFFYHSSCTPPGIVGIVEVVKAGYPDHTAWDINSEHFDSKSTSEKPIWFMVDVKLIEKFPAMITLEELKNHPFLNKMQVTQRGSRLSITPVTADEWKIILKMVKQSV